MKSGSFIVNYSTSDLIELLINGEQGHILAKNSSIVNVKFSYPDPKGTFDLVQIKGESWLERCSQSNVLQRWFLKVEMEVEVGVYAYKFVVEGVSRPN